ncbi:hypothetical protein BD410DRAFT_806532 [Rickenella mellea]|uniref:Uncharacterized protein n=1 Tax=Rickenella mellea TaxID=50990 RepID=A0A4Y7PUI1_9AGAM|nr:hypothetical protein BD410DRAFT_806532 [Rickenella mellea]
MRFYALLPIQSTATGREERNFKSILLRPLSKTAFEAKCERCSTQDIVYTKHDSVSTCETLHEKFIPAASATSQDPRKSTGPKSVSSKSDICSYPAELNFKTQKTETATEYISMGASPVHQSEVQGDVLDRDEENPLVQIWQHGVDPSGSQEAFQAYFLNIRALWVRNDRCLGQARVHYKAVPTHDYQNYFTFYAIRITPTGLFVFLAQNEA